MARTFEVLGALRREVSDIDRAMLRVLRRLDELLRCQNVTFKMVKHLHSQSAARKMRDTVRGNRK